MAAPKKGGLGRGLDALFADAVPAYIEEPEKATPVKEEKNSKTKKPVKAAAPEMKSTNADNGDSVSYLDINSIMPNANQPRKTFDPERISELANSIREHGIIQPIVVRKKGKSFEIVAGERRWRAAREAELTKVPCLVRELDDEQNMLFAIIENMQREDLNPVEEAEGLDQMIKGFGMTQEQVSKSLGKSRPYIANSLRLLKLPDYIREDLSKGLISAAHGRTLVTIEDEKLRKQLVEKIKKEGLSVRETEKLVNSVGKPKKKKNSPKKDPDVSRVEEELKEIFGTRVNISNKNGKGKIEIEYFSRDELERLIELLKTL